MPGGAILLRLDALAAAFLLVIFLVSGLGSVYGLGYWSREEQPRSAARLRFFYALMTVGLALVVTAAHAVLFLLAWELMAVSAFFLVATDDAEARGPARGLGVPRRDARRHGLPLRRVRAPQGGDRLVRDPEGRALSRESVVFLLAVVGFGMKAGIVPLHFWLPAAHASAPSHVSALMSGVMLKAGIYGILRFSSLVEVPPLWWGLLLAGLGAVSAVSGIAMAAGQTDIKRALAYSSVENMGIVWLGIGLALAGRALGRPSWVALGFCGALFHVFSHACFKSLLFFGSGGILHATHTRNMERLGGLARRMPVTAGLVLVGALAAAGLPLFNGFVGEWLIALGLFDTLRSSSLGRVATRVRSSRARARRGARGRVLRPDRRRHVPRRVAKRRSRRGARGAAAHDGPDGDPRRGVSRTGPLAVRRPPGAQRRRSARGSARPWARRSSRRRSPGPFGPSSSSPSRSRPPARGFSPSARALPAGSRRGIAATRRRPRGCSTRRGRSAPRSPRCCPASSRRLRVSPKPGGAFPGAASFRTEAPDPFGAKLYEPFVARWAGRLARLRRLQSGRLTLYLVYVFLTMLVTLAWSVLRPYVR